MLIPPPKKLTIDTIVIIEDEPAVRRALESACTKFHMPYEPFANLRTAHEYLIEKRKPAGVVFIDYGLPDGNGLTLVREIYKHRPELEPVIMTGTIDGEDKVKKEGVAVKVLQKPFDLQSAIDIICDYARKRANLNSAEALPPSCSGSHSPDSSYSLLPAGSSPTATPSER